MNVKRVVTIATAAAALSVGVAVAPANAEGLIPDTPGAYRAAVNTITGSTDAGSSVETAYGWTQFGWFVLWATVAATGVGLIGLVAQTAGLIPAGTITVPALPF